MTDVLAKVAEVAEKAAEASLGAEIDPDLRIEATDCAGKTGQSSEVDPDMRIRSHENRESVDASRLDDNGKAFKNEEGELLPDMVYEVNGTKYTTDELGRIIRAEGYLKDTPDTKRDRLAQYNAGGNDSKPCDEGGHLRALMNGGYAGNGNIVLMRDIINRGDYKSSENEENRMLKAGKQVYERIELTYDGDSARPSKFEKMFTDGEKTFKVSFDNVKGSTELIDEEEFKEIVSDQDISSLNDEISDMRADGNDVSVTSVWREYDGEGKLTWIGVRVRNETSSQPVWKNFKPMA